MPHQLLWAKTNRKINQTHPLVCHLIDVGHTALAMWNTVLTSSARVQIAQWFSLDVDAAGRLVAFLAALHDLGKASPSFQRKYPDAVAPLERAGFPFPEASKASPHGTVSAWALAQLLPAALGIDRRAASELARVLGGHHGTWPLGAEVRGVSPGDRGDKTWDAAREALFADVKAVFHPPGGAALPGDRQARNALFVLLSGLVSVVDWIGSNETYFAFQPQPIDALHYAAQAGARAHAALKTLGWTGWQPTGETLGFNAMFPHIEAPRPAQKTVIGREGDLTPPGLLIVEAPTGTGKTETALYLADRWAQIAGQRGLYVAMPTMATSNQMFRRVIAFLESRYPSDHINAHLVHSQAAWDEKIKAMELAAIEDEEGAEEGRIAAMAWFMPRKRTLLAPFGVGTVDQALMSVLQTRHFFVRLFGLSGKTIIFDEVHAYDTYMVRLFHDLMAWLRAVGASAIVLSATLPERTRRELAAAYAGREIDLPDADYPRATWISAGGETFSIPLPAPESRTLNLESVSRDPAAIAGLLEQALVSGGCAAVICNTVGRAQEVYQAVREAGFVPDEGLTLFHARFPAAWRKAIEDDVLACFGKDGTRPEKAVVVATQVIEQSLDLDFDIMVTDLAPIDLVLQRAGRLHRHAVRDAVRPPGLSDPRLLVAMPPEAEVPRLARSDTYIYDAYVMLRTYGALAGKTSIALPDETAALIESVYGPPPDFDALPAVLGQALSAAWERLEKARRDDIHEAKNRTVSNPKDSMMLGEKVMGLKEDNPEVDRALQPMTRRMGPSVTLVCLHRVDGQLYLEPEGTGAPVDLDALPGSSQAEQLLQRTLTLQHYAIREHFLAQDVPAAWDRVAALRYARPICFEGGVYSIDGYMLKLTRDVGLEIVKG